MLLEAVDIHKSFRQSGNTLHVLKGIDFIEKRLIGGCKGSAANNAIICRPWSHDEQKRATDLGCRFIETPLQLSEISAWLKGIEENTPVNRKLAPLPDVP